MSDHESPAIRYGREVGALLVQRELGITEAEEDAATERLDALYRELSPEERAMVEAAFARRAGTL